MKVGYCANVYSKLHGGVNRGAWWPNKADADFYGDPDRIAIIRIKSIKENKQ